MKRGPQSLGLTSALQIIICTLILTSDFNPALLQHMDGWMDGWTQIYKKHTNENLTVMLAEVKVKIELLSLNGSRIQFF